MWMRMRIWIWLQNALLMICDGNDTMWRNFIFTNLFKFGLICLGWYYTIGIKQCKFRIYAVRCAANGVNSHKISNVSTCFTLQEHRKMEKLDLATPHQTWIAPNLIANKVIRHPNQTSPPLWWQNFPNHSLENRSTAFSLLFICHFLGFC